MLQLNQSGNKMTAMIWNVLKTNTESKKSSDAMFPFQDALPLKHAPRWRRASLSCMYQQPSARWWRRRACYKCFSFVIPFCTCFLERKPDGRERSENPEVISRSETSADTGHIRSVQGQADKDRTARPGLSYTNSFAFGTGAHIW